nr:unnamed protein product [Digitaria exilis]
MSRQRKAAAATRDLLKLDAARVQKAGAAPMRNDAPAPAMRKLPGRPRAPPVPEQRSGAGPNATPPGGFTNFIQPNLSQNFIFGGEPSQYAPFRPPQTTHDVESEQEFSTPPSAKDSTTYVNVEDYEEVPRSEKKDLLDSRKICQDG